MDLAFYTTNVSDCASLFRQTDQAILSFPKEEKDRIHDYGRNSGYNIKRHNYRNYVLKNYGFLTNLSQIFTIYRDAVFDPWIAFKKVVDGDRYDTII